MERLGTSGSACQPLQPELSGAALLLNGGDPHNRDIGRMIELARASPRGPEREDFGAGDTAEFQHLIRVVIHRPDVSRAIGCDAIDRKSTRLNSSHLGI